LIFKIIVDTGIKISLVYIVLGFADYAYQRWKFRDDMKMTKQEVKDEYKNSEGDPAIKGKQRQRMMEASQRRMMQSVPQADVVITNPTHIAVAILYDNTKDEAPRVVAKGEDYLAKKIKDTAKDSGVPIVENKPLARALYATVDVDQVIPPELYQAVAEILAVVYTNRAS
jgi:flagellar biosynthetic protein FlhB